MVQDKPIKFGVIGAGKIGTFHTRTLAKMKGVTLVGVCDPDVMRAQKLAWAHNCTPYTKPEELVGQVDAVIVAAPTQLHHQIGMYFLEHGVHTLVEKPIAVTMEEARDLIQAAKRHNLVLQVGHVERFNPAVVEAVKYIKDPRFITITRQGPYDGRMANISVVLDLMIHDIDLLYTIVPSEVVHVDAVGLSVFSPHEDIANVRLHFANGAVADVTASRASFERARFMHLFQPDGYVSVDFMNARVKTYRKEKPDINNMNDLTVNYPKVENNYPLPQKFCTLLTVSKRPAHLPPAARREPKPWNWRCKFAKK